MPNIRVKVPERAARDEIVEIRTLIMHPMENGFRFETAGTVVPVHIIHTFICRYDGEEVFRAELQPGIAANPYLSFFTRATHSGTLEFEWQDDDGSVYRESARIEVA
jgi:sulfur-oxidizing protein SoxZ